jgi:predicted Rossmann fold flavoprotein
MKTYDLIVVGAGASGLAAAIAFGRRCKGAALLIDANAEPGAKILATGNGRCNLSNEAAPGWETSRYFFDSLGVLLDKDEAGRVYPSSRQAVTVRDALVCECKKLGCEFLAGMRVASAERGDDDDFVASVTRAKPGSDGAAESGGGFAFRAKQVIIATGGKACPRYGNMGDGYAFARALGIRVNPIRPALVPFVYTDEAKGGLAVLSGVRARAKVKLLAYGDVTGYKGTDAAVVAEARGEVQFTDYGLSGICVFDLSRFYEGGGAYAVHIDLAPNHSEKEIIELVHARRAAGLSGIVHPKIAGYVERSIAVASSDGQYAARVAATVKNLVAPVKGTKGWKDAQTTAGGVAIPEVGEKRFESKAAPGLFFVGEALDYDGPSGGYNLDYAWNTGLKAGKAAGAYCASYLQDD